MQRRTIFLLRAGDLVALMVGFAVAAEIVFGTWVPWHAPVHGEDSIWSLLGLMVAGFFVGSVVVWRSGPFHAPRPSYGRAVAIVAVSLVVTMAGIVITRGYWSRAYLAWSSVIWVVGSLAFRFVLRRGVWLERVLIVSDDKRLVADLESTPHLDIVDLVDPIGVAPAEGTDGVTLVLDLRTSLSDEMAQFVASWTLAGASVRSLASLYEEHLGRLPMVHIPHGWELATPVGKNDYEPIKRLLDLVLVVMTLPLSMALAIVIWAAIRLDSPGPTIFAQTRVGRYHKPFTLYKFRTMVDDAEADGPQFAAPRDPRLTRVGKVLRRFRIDEIPQLWCVLKGDLSLIGPRPERPFFAERFEREIPFFSYRTLVRPGVTGWAQVKYGYADDMADTVEKLTFDLYYVKHMSLWLDLQILGKSVRTVLTGFGAQ
jgi:exopolysaccharide biosynthesis polyprenyl glycosylphosphotransferase